MATITGLTAARMLEIEGDSIVDGEIIGGKLILTKHDGTTVDAGPVVGPAGPSGPPGPAGGQIPGEIKMWSGTVLPALATFGKWVWADGGVYANATYPLAAGNIGAQWRTFAGAVDPGAGNFRVPDLRGLVPAGLDAMPGGARANRMTRTVAITLAGRTGEETHLVTVNEIPVHAHGINDPGHAHSINGNGVIYNPATDGEYPIQAGSPHYSFDPAPSSVNPSGTGISIGATGGGAAHENVQPTVFVPYIVKLDG